MIVLDASAALAALLNAGSAREVLKHEQIHAPHLIDAEIVNALRRMASHQKLTSDVAFARLAAWRRLELTRSPMTSLLDRMWELRVNLSAYDAAYIALAESLNCVLWTADARLSRSPGARCSITVVPGF